MNLFRIIPILVLISFLLNFPCLGQSRSGSKPAIIRDTDIAEGIEKEKEPVERDPAKAKKNIEVGDFNYKQENYVGAIGRYLTAMEYQPDSTKAYKSLVKAYKSLVNVYESRDRTPESLDKAEARHGKIPTAIDYFTDFLSDNPDSIKGDDLRKMIAKLKEISSQFPYRQ
jgi:tetratricopeptide (TPR) repeat protein